MSENEKPTVYQRLLKARGEEIRRGREEKGWSQAELASYAGTSQQTVDRLERGVVESSKAYPRIRQVLGMDMYGYDSFPFKDHGEIEAPPSIPQSVVRESQALDLIDKGRIPVITMVNGEMKLVDAIPRVFPYEFAQRATAVLISNDDMEPVLRVGDIVVLHPNIPARVGNEVGFAAEGKMFIRTLIEEDDESWTVQSWKPVGTRRILKKTMNETIEVAVTRIMKAR